MIWARGEFLYDEFSEAEIKIRKFVLRFKDELGTMW